MRLKEKHKDTKGTHCCDGEREIGCAAPEDQVILRNAWSIFPLNDDGQITLGRRLNDCLQLWEFSIFSMTWLYSYQVLLVASVTADEYWLEFSTVSLCLSLPFVFPISSFCFWRWSLMQLRMTSGPLSSNFLVPGLQACATMHSLGGVGGWTQGFMDTRQAFYWLSYIHLNLYLSFWDTVSLCSPSWPGTRCVIQVGFKLSAIFLPQPLTCWDCTCGPPLPSSSCI